MAKSTPSSDKPVPNAEAARRAASLGLVFKNGWYVPSRSGPPVTSELVQHLLDEADLEDAGLAGDYHEE
jgi:hypothetical protein